MMKTEIEIRTLMIGKIMECEYDSKEFKSIQDENLYIQSTSLVQESICKKLSSNERLFLYKEKIRRGIFPFRITSMKFTGRRFELEINNEIKSTIEETKRDIIIIKPIMVEKYIVEVEVDLRREQDTSNKCDVF